MKVVIAKKEYPCLTNGTNLDYPTYYILRLVDDDPTAVDRLFQETRDFVVEDDEGNQRDCQGNGVINLSFYHHQEIGRSYNKQTREMEIQYGDVILIYIEK